MAIRAARGKECAVCICDERAAIDAALMTKTTPTVRREYPQFTQSQLYGHKQNHVTSAAALKAVAAVPKAPVYPKLPETALPLERASATCDWLRQQIDYAVATKVGQKELTQLIGQLTNANRLHARLAGALDITEAQIVRSAPWAKIMVVVRDSLKGHPKALNDLTLAIEAAADGERG